MSVPASWNTSLWVRSYSFMASGSVRRPLPNCMHERVQQTPQHTARISSCALWRANAVYGSSQRQLSHAQLS